MGCSSVPARGLFFMLTWRGFEQGDGAAAFHRGIMQGSTGRPKKLPKDVEEDLLAEVQRLRAENDYLKNLQALVLEDERRQHKKRW